MKHYSFVICGIATFISMLFPLDGHSQITTNYYDFIPTSPNVEEMTKYSTLPVSTYTGIPEISIPLGKLVCGPITLPIFLSYYAGGIKVDQVASNVGLGWSLNAGGVIGQTVHKEDDLTTSTRYVLSQEEVANNTHLTKDELFSLQMSNIDCAPDIFSYNFAGFSGQFVMDKDKKFYEVRGKQDFDIKYANHTFTLTDLYGNRYIFSDMETCETCTHYYNCSFSQNKLYQASADSRRYNVPTGYYLTKIEDPSGYFSINFYYTKEVYTVEGRLEGSLFFDVQSAKEGKTAWKEAGVLSQNGLDGSHTTQVPSGNFSQTSVTYNALKLSKIKTSTGEECNLAYSIADRKDLPGSKELQGLTITSQKGFPSKWIFAHSYFDSSVKAQDGRKQYLNYRLKLDAVKQMSLDNKDSLYYGLSYYAQKMPFRTSFCGQDMWGYCNGEPEQNETVQISKLFPVLDDIGYMDRETISMSGVYGYPSGSNTFAFPKGSDREVNPNFIHAYSLGSISYPKGKNYHFTYEPNVCFYAGSRIIGTYVVGGLRVQKITSYMDNNTNLKQEYSYCTKNTAGAYISSGSITSSPMQIIQQPLMLDNQKNGNVTYDIFLKLNSQTFAPAYTVGGDFIGYDEVTERTTEGKTVYRYMSSRNAPQKYKVALIRQYGDLYTESLSSSPFPAPHLSSGIGYLFTPTPNGFDGNCWERGLLTSKSIYDNKNSLIFFENYTYDYNQTRTIYGFEPFKPSSGNEQTAIRQYMYATRYEISIGKSLVRSCTTTEYRKDAKMSQNKSYTYNTFDLPYHITQTFNQKDSVVTQVSYPTDLKYGIYPSMVNKRIVGIPIETVVRHNGVIKDLKLNTYTLNNGMYLNNEKYTMSFNGSVPNGFNFFNGQEKDSRYAEPDYKVLAYNKQGNPIATIDRNGLNHVFIWDFSGRLRVHVENASLTSVLSYCPNLQNGQVVDSEIKQMRLGLTDSFVTDFRYNYGLVSSVTDAKGLSNYFKFDGLGRLVEEHDNEKSIVKKYEYHY